MNNLLIYFLEINVYMVSFYLLYQLLLAKDKHFLFNRGFLLSGILLSIALPFLSINLQTNLLDEKFLEGYIVLPAITISNVQMESVGFILKWPQFIGIIYIAGVIFYLGRLSWQLIHICKHLPLFNSSRERKNGYTLVSTDGKIPTCSFFKFLFWDKSVSLSDEEEKQILEHEMVHIRQYHSVDVLIVELLRAVFWINPVIHLMKSRITEVHEYLADHYATKEIGVENYSKLLTLQIFKSFDFALSNNFHKSQVVKRIRMLKTNRSKSIWINVALLAPALSLLVTVLACDVTGTEDFSSLVVTEQKETLVEETTLEEIVAGDITHAKEIFTKVDEQPVPMDGMASFYKQIRQSMKYPVQARRMGIEGKVFIQFVVDENGKLTDVKSVKGIGAGCAAEAERVIQESAAWNPGFLEGRAVNVRMVLPITFKLG